jgi:hypothetical protein
MVFLLLAAGATPISAELRPKAAPPAPPIERRSTDPFQPRSLQPQTVPAGLSLYSIGEPTAQEQLYLEYINRARANPAAEAVRLASITDQDVLHNYEVWSVDLDLMIADISALPAAPPLAMNAKLLAAARLHSQDMLENAFQGHRSSDGSTMAERIDAQGYNWNRLGENVFSYAISVEHGHAGFEVDWGEPPNSIGGMQHPPGHRESIHDPEFRELGIGVVTGTNGAVGPQVVTQNFGSSNQSRFVTGVVYYDFNGNKFYDAGEGIGGVTVRVPGSSFYAVTSSSGGYAVPAPNDGEHIVTFSADPLPEAQFVVVIAAGQNVKLDYLPSFIPSIISGPEQPSINQENHYTITRVAGATGYQWRGSRSISVNGLIEGAENGFTKVIPEVTPGYVVLDNVWYSSGRYSFRLAHPQPARQTLTLDRVFRLGTAAELLFASRIGLASTSQVAIAQISLDRGGVWENVWSQTGTGGAGEAGFSLRRVPLAKWAGREIMVRFRYDFKGGSYFPQTHYGAGFNLDDIALVNAHEITEEFVGDVSSGNSFSFVPPQTGPYLLSIRPILSGRFLEWGSHKQVMAQVGPPPPPVIRILNTQLLAGSRAQIDFTVANPASGLYLVQSAPTPAGPWIVETSAAISTHGAVIRALTARQTTPQRFFRILTQ